MLSVENIKQTKKTTIHEMHFNKMGIFDLSVWSFIWAVEHKKTNNVQPFKKCDDHLAWHTPKKHLKRKIAIDRNKAYILNILNILNTLEHLWMLDIPLDHGIS